VDFEQRLQVVGRRVIVGGTLDHELTTLLSAQLMTLDGESADPVDLLISGSGGPTVCLLPVIDIIKTMRAPVTTRATAVVSGTAGCLVALGTGRRAMAAHAQLSIRVGRGPDGPAVDTAGLDELEHLVTEHRRQRESLVGLLVARSGASAETIAGELDAGELHSPASALSLGLVDRRPA